MTFSDVKMTSPLETKRSERKRRGGDIGETSKTLHLGTPSDKKARSSKKDELKPVSPRIQSMQDLTNIASKPSTQSKKPLSIKV